MCPEIYRYFSLLSIQRRSSEVHLSESVEIYLSCLPSSSVCVGESMLWLDASRRVMYHVGCNSRFCEAQVLYRSQSLECDANCKMLDTQCLQVAVHGVCGRMLSIVGRFQSVEIASAITLSPGAQKQALLDLRRGDPLHKALFSELQARFGAIRYQNLP